MFLASFTGKNLLQLIFYLAVLVGVLIVTFYVTKWIGGYQKNQLFNRNFEVIETMKVSNNKFLQIVRIGADDYYIIAVGKEEVNLIGKLEKSQINFSDNAPRKGGFQDILASFRSKDEDSASDDSEDKGDRDHED